MERIASTLESWMESREPMVTTIGAACAFVASFVATWLVVAG